MKKKVLWVFMALYLAILIVSIMYSTKLVVLEICIGLCIIFCVILGLLLNRWVKTTLWFRSVIPDLDNYPTNYWYREHLARNYDIVNIGSSSAKNAFDYSGIDIKAFNWADQPQSLSYGYKVLKTYFSILKNDGIVVISLGPFSGLDVDDKWAKYINDKYYYILDPNLIDDYRHVALRRTYPLLMSPFKSFKALVNKLLRRNVDKTNSNVFISDEEKWYIGWLEEFNIEDINAPLSEENEVGQSKRIALLSDIMDFCLRRNLRPVIVIPPMHPSLALKLSDKFRENYIYSFIRRSNKANVPFFNYMDDSRFSDDVYFKNSFLLNEVGAKYFTKIFLKELGLI